MTVTKFPSTHTPIAAALHAAFVGLAFATGAGGVAPSAHAGAGSGEESNKRSFRIPAGPLGPALSRFATRAGARLSFDPALTEGKTTRGLSGDFTREEGLAQRTMKIQRKSTSTTTADPKLTFLLFSLQCAFLGLSMSAQTHAQQTRPDAEQTEDTTQSEVVTLPAITVEGARESAYGPVEGYKASRSGTATKTDTPIFDVPASIQVVPREVIEDQNATRLADALGNVSSVQSNGTQGNRFETFSVRGFSINRLAKDGFLAAASFLDAGFLDLANIERVEVLKGPASVLYGQNEPGGLINLVTKKPQEVRFYSFDATAGSYDFYRGEVDLNQPITADNSWLFRLNAAYQNADSFRDYFIDSDRTLIAPSLRWVPSQDTTLDLQLEYYDQKQQMDNGLVVVDGRPDVLPRDRFLGERYSQYRADELRFNAILDHRFNATWSLRSALRAATTDALRFGDFPIGLQADNRSLARISFTNPQEFSNYAVQTNLIGRFDTGMLGHEVLIGLDGNITRFESDFQSGTLDPIDVFNPVYGAQPGAFGPVSTQDRHVDFYGLYLQDLISFGDHWKLLLGGRYDYADTEFARNGQLETDVLDKKFSPRAGLVFQPTQNLSLYASYAESFLPFLGNVSFDGTPFEPESGEQYEVGAKTEFFGGRLSATLAVFELTRQNVSTTDPVNPNFSIQTGEQRSRGVELDVGGEILPGWDVIASAAYLDAEITEDEDFEIGNRLANVPKWSGSLWSTYAFVGGFLRGLEVGAGAFAVGRREGDLDNTFEAPGYVRLDAVLIYRFSERITAQINVENLLDKYYIEAVGPFGATEIYPGAPRSVFGQVAVTF